MQRAIVRTIRDHYRRDSVAPSVRTILRMHTALSRNRFYQIFPEGLREACQRADVPVPVNRIQQTAGLNAARDARSESLNDPPSTATNLTLTLEQTQRVYGLMHLEGWRSPSEVITQLLDEDAAARSHQLSFTQRRLVADVLDSAHRAGWSMDDDHGFVATVSQLHNLGLTRLPTATVQGLLKLTATLHRHGWTATDFVQHATRHHNALQLYLQYQHGSITYDEFERRMRRVA